MYKKAKNKNGFTLIEIVLVLAILGVVIATSINPIILSTKGHDMAVKEYDLQSAVRRAVEKTNQVIRYSRAVFAVPETFVSDISKMDPGWNYLMVSKDGKKIISMEYVRHDDDDDDDGNDSGEFVEKILVPEHKNIKYKVFFEKNADAAGDTVMDYVIYVYTVDEKGNETSEKIMFETTVETVNSVQVADKGTGISKGAAPSIALAYRGDGSSATGRNEIVYITLIVDVSGSMDSTPDGGQATIKDWWGNIIEIKDSRMDLVKKALIENDNGISIIEQFKQENIYISLIPFSTYANYPDPAKKTSSKKRHPIHDMFNKKVYVISDNNVTKYDEIEKQIGSGTYNDDKENLKDKIERLSANGGTNTGDGLRHAYHLHNDFRTLLKIDEKIKTHHYIILLIDGKSTFETTNKVKWSRPNWYSNWEKISAEYFTDKGNLNVDTTTPSGSSPSEYNRLAVSGLDGSKFVGNDYIESIGELITSFDDGKGIKSYIIGYDSDLEENIVDIGEKIGTELGEGLGTKTCNIFAYSQKDFDLQEVFQDIANDIMADYWMVAGPQIKN